MQTLKAPKNTKTKHRRNLLPSVKLSTSANSPKQERLLFFFSFFFFDKENLSHGALITTTI